MYQPIQLPTAQSLNLAIIGNCAISALVDQQGDIVWCCLPRFDSTPVFHALLGSPTPSSADGRLAVEIENFCRVEQGYDQGTAILRTRLFDQQGQGIEITDFAPRFEQRDRMFRPAQLVRRIRAISGHPRIRIQVKPRGEVGRAVA